MWIIFLVFVVHKIITIKSLEVMLQFSKINLEYTIYKIKLNSNLLVINSFTTILW